MKKSHFEELKQVLKLKTRHDNKEVLFRVSLYDQGDGEYLSFYSDRIDNVYNQGKGWRWEIMLSPNGKWRIS